MLYPKSNEITLQQTLFENPSCEYRGAPFWAWNCKLDKNELLRQIGVLKEMGMGGAHMHVRTGMETVYLSDEHMELIKACVAKFKHENMLGWLYDEDRWPSGAAGGLVTRDERYRAKHLLFTSTPYDCNRSIKTNAEYDADITRTHNGHLLACFDVLLDDHDCLHTATQIDQSQEARGIKWYAYVETRLCLPWFNNQTYSNTLDKETITQFINITYERYLQAVGEEFGGVVPAIFTDEPQFTIKQTLDFANQCKDVILPWTDDLPDTFRMAYAQDLIAHIPELIWELPDRQVSAIRYQYHDHVAERFALAFADNCGRWCKQHQIMLTGHLNDEPTLQSQTASLGDAMRSYRSFHLPGIDILCGWREFTTAKQAQSAAHQYGCPGVLSELYGVTGWNYDFRGHKLQGDWQAALGVTTRVHHLSWVSMIGEAKRDYPASINYQSPWWKDYSFVENHFARINTALTRGKPVVRVGVIHPVESYWLHWGPKEQTLSIRKQLNQQFAGLTEWLITGSIDFDFICESLLPSQCMHADAPLCVGEMRYDTVIVPGCETLRQTTIDRLHGFLKGGGRLIFLGDAPKLVDAKPSMQGVLLWESAQKEPFDKESILTVLQSVRHIDIRNEDGSRTDNLIHQLRQDQDSLWLFIAHSNEPYNKDISKAQPIRITVQGQYTVQLYDTQTGQIKPVITEIQNGQTIISEILYDYDSILLHLSNDQYHDKAKSVETKPFTRNRIDVPVRVDYTLDEPNVYLLDKAEFALDDWPYQQETELLRADNKLRTELGWPLRKKNIAQPWTIRDEKIERSVRLRFTVHFSIDVPDVTMALEDAEAAKILIDGKSFISKPEGWYVDKAIKTLPLGDITRGSHTIEVILPFGRRTNVEWCYLLGEFGVNVQGEYREIQERPIKLGFDDVTRQGLAHYGGNISYHIPIETNSSILQITVPHYDGTAIRVQVNDKVMGYIAYSPYQLAVKMPGIGKHILTLTLLGNRQNAFGPVHLADEKEKWISADAWRSQGDRWTDSYRLSSLGIRSAPIIMGD